MLHPYLISSTSGGISRLEQREVLSDNYGLNPGSGHENQQFGLNVGEWNGLNAKSIQEKILKNIRISSEG